MTVCICDSPLRLLSHAHQTGITIQGVQKLLEVELKWLRKVRVCVNDSSLLILHANILLHINCRYYFARIDACHVLYLSHTSL